LIRQACTTKCSKHQQIDLSGICEHVVPFMLDNTT
jgi:hypothetical protein